MKIKGFMGRTHAVLSICLMMICMLIPLDIFKETVWILKDNLLLFFIGIIILVGGSLFPDLDNNVSYAGSKLGLLGSVFTIFMQSSSAVVWNIYRFKGDRPPLTQHRYLWHTPFIGIGIILMFWFGLPTGDYNLLTNISNSISTGNLGYFIRTNSILVLFMILAFMATLVGSAMVINRIRDLFNLPWGVQYLLPTLVLIYIMTTSYDNLRVLGLCFGAGYLFHIIEDFFADSGLPMLFPIPSVWTGKVWQRYRFPITVKTGGVINNIIDIVAGIAALILVIVVIIRR